MIQIIQKLVCLLVVALFCTCAYSQNPVTILISGTEYDSPALKALRDAFKKNSKVSLLKSSYTDGTATITLNYNGAAEDLWETIPSTNKKGFKVTSLTDEQITLEYISVTKTTSGGSEKKPPANTTTSSSKSTSKDCNTCLYFPLCEYDYIRSFQGKTFYGIDYDGRMVYYRVENGNLIEKTEQVDEDGYPMGTYQTKIKLKCNAAKGSTWGYTAQGGFGVSGDEDYEIVGKGISHTVDGKTYNDVLQIRVSITTKAPDFSGRGKSTEQVIKADEFFYARNVGLIDVKSVKEFSLMGTLMGAEGMEKINNAMGEEKMKEFNNTLGNKPVDNSHPTTNTGNSKLSAENQKMTTNRKPQAFTGIVDQSIIGTWGHSNANITVFHIYKADGSGEAYTGSITPKTLTRRFNWRINKGTLEEQPTESYFMGRTQKHANAEISQSRIRKLNHPDDGRKTFTVDNWVFFKQNDNSSFNQNELQQTIPDSVSAALRKQISTLTGQALPELAGTWQRINPWRHPDTGEESKPDYYVFSADGYYKHYYGGLSPDNITFIDPSLWRINANQIELLTTQWPIKVNRQAFTKTGDKIMIGTYEYKKIK